MDRRTALYVGLCLAFLLGYQWWIHRMGWDHPAATRPSAVAESTRTGVTPAPPGMAPAVGTPATGAPATGTPASGTGASLTATPPPSPAQMERTFTLETPLYRATFSNRGARLLAVELSHYRSAGAASVHGRTVSRPKPGQPVPEGERVTLAGGPAFGLDLGSGAHLRSLATTVFAVDDSADATGAIRRLSFAATDSTGTRVIETWRVRPDTYALDLDVEMHAAPAGPHVDDYSLTIRSWPTFTEANRKSDDLLLRATSLVGTNYHRDAARDLVKGRLPAYDGNVRWVAVQSRYFIAAVAVAQAPARGASSAGEHRAVPPGTESQLGRNEPPVENVAASTLVAAAPAESQPRHRYVVYFGPTDYTMLERLNVGLERAVDLGFTWLRPISHVLLVLLQWIERFVRNWGMAIVVLATLVRLVLHPLNIASLRSMRAMQRLQPELDRLKEKYKNNAQELNLAMMALYRENKVNPAGGCLPIVLQMPIFFALYAVLSNAIALRQAPFVGWIDDLSSPDVLFMVGAFPVRLLPVLMAGTGLLQQKLTPMAPQQAPSAYLMNVMMLVLFYNAVPSGLVLYWTVMNVLTIAQQWLVLRGDSAPPQSAAVVVEDEPRRPRKERGGGQSARR